MNPAAALLRAADAAHAAGRIDEAETLYGRALAAAPGLAGALYGLGVVRARQARRGEAIGLLRRAMVAAPGFAAGWRVLGEVLLEDGQPEAAVQCLQAALTRAPGEAAGRRLLGQALAAEARLLARRNAHAEALRRFERAAALQPEVASHRWNAALARLALGDLRGGFAAMEARWELAGVFPAAGRRMHQPRWDGREDLSGRTVLVWAEQGFGDCFQFARFVPGLAARGARLVLEAPAAVLPVLAGIEGVAEAVPQGAPLPAHDRHVPMMSLPFLLGTDRDSLPAPRRYLAAPDGAAAHWRGRLAGIRGVRVGLAWSGSAAAAGLENRSDRLQPLPLAALGPLGAVPGVSFVSLQKDAREAPPAGLVLHDWMGEAADFGATAGLIEALDLVVAIDSAVAHLAAALGREVWLLNRWDSDWRWVTTPAWYPTVRPFRQAAPGAWAAVVEAVAAALAQRVGGHE